MIVVVRRRRSDELDDYDGRDGPISMRQRFQSPIVTAREGPREESDGGVEDECDDDSITFYSSRKDLGRRNDCDPRLSVGS